MKIGIVLSTVRKNWFLLKVVLFHSNQFCYTVDGNFPVFIPDSKQFLWGLSNEVSFVFEFQWEGSQKYQNVFLKISYVV